MEGGEREREVCSGKCPADKKWNSATERRARRSEGGGGGRTRREEEGGGGRFFPAAKLQLNIEKV